MGRTFIWTCDHRLHRSDLINGPDMSFPLDCYLCHCGRRLMKLFSDRCDKYDKLTNLTAINEDDEVEERKWKEIEEIEEWKQKECDKLFSAYEREFLQKCGNGATRATAGMGHDEMLKGLVDRDGTKAYGRRKK